MNASVPCIVCRDELRDVFPGYKNNQPFKGLAVLGYGHYGCTVFDPMDGSYLEMNICEPCLIRAAGDGLVLHHKALVRPHQRSHVKWKPPASRIEARSDETPTAAQPEGREPDPKGDAQTTASRNPK